MKALELTKQGEVFVLTLIDGENQNAFTEEVLNEYHAVMDEIEATTQNAALLITSSTPKIWSTGINLEWIKQQPTSYLPEFKALMDKMYMRLSLLNLPTIGCLNGHTFAGGAIMACALDFRFMNADKGWFCFPEVDIQITFTPKMHAVVDSVGKNRALKELLLTGKKIDGKQAFDSEIVDGAFSSDQLFEKSLEFAATMAKKDRATYHEIKRGVKSDLLKFV